MKRQRRPPTKTFLTPEPSIHYHPDRSVRESLQDGGLVDGSQEVNIPIRKWGGGAPRRCGGFPSDRKRSKVEDV